MKLYLLLLVLLCLGAVTPPSTSEKYYRHRNFNGLNLYLLEKSYLQDADGSNTLEFRAPTDLTDDNTLFVLPGENGRNKELLQTDGSGNLSYTAEPVVVKTSLYTAQHRDYIGANTSGGGFVVECPASPEDGDWFVIFDVTGDFSVNNLTLDGNGNNIQETAEDYIFDIDYVIFGSLSGIVFCIERNYAFDNIPASRAIAYFEMIPGFLDRICPLYAFHCGIIKRNPFERSYTHVPSPSRW